MRRSHCSAASCSSVGKGCALPEAPAAPCRVFAAANEASAAALPREAAGSLPSDPPFSPCAASFFAASANSLPGFCCDNADVFAASFGSLPRPAVVSCDEPFWLAPDAGSLPGVAALAAFA